MKKQKECVIANEVKQSQTRKGSPRRFQRLVMTNNLKHVIANEVKQSQTNNANCHCEKCAAFRGNLMTKPAFTLAEVLITLGIIGIVAALTIPALMQKTNNKELVAGTLKMGTTLSNALKGMESVDMVGVDKLADVDTFAEKFKKQLKTTNCTNHSICLADGSYFDYSNPQFGGHCDKETPCVEIVADINGKKGPNKEGKDQYTFLVTNRGIIPLGATETCTGLDCTAYVMANQNLWEGETTN